MPISNELKLIFIHIPKNAGTAITNSKTAKFFSGGHQSAKEIMNQYPKEWNQYFKFAVVRNPWDRVVSNYEYAIMEKSYWHHISENNTGAAHFDYHTLKNKTFEDCVNLLYKNRESLRHQGWSPQYVWISDNDKNVLVDKIFYHEKLDTDEEFNKMIPDLEKVNISPRKSTNYKDYYTDDLINKVSEIYDYDIKLFKFEY
jgi:hypothetical protein